MPTQMDKVLGNIAASVAGSKPRRGCLRGTGSDDRASASGLHRRRGLCGPFNTAIVRLARERAGALMREGKEVKFFCVGRKGCDQLRRLYASADRRDGRSARGADAALRARRR